MASHAFIGWSSTAPTVQAAEWLARHVPAESLVYRSSSLINQFTAARAGIGLALLPCYLADGEAGLRRVLPPVAGLLPELWMITHDSLKSTARVRAFMELVGDGIRRQFAKAA